LSFQNHVSLKSATEEANLHQDSPHLLFQIQDTFSSPLRKVPVHHPCKNLPNRRPIGHTSLFFLFVDFSYRSRQNSLIELCKAAAFRGDEVKTCSVQAGCYFYDKKINKQKEA
jgi:hypothetical protein